MKTETTANIIVLAAIYRIIKKRADDRRLPDDPVRDIRDRKEHFPAVTSDGVPSPPDAAAS